MNFYKKIIDQPISYQINLLPYYILQVHHCVLLLKTISSERNFSLSKYLMTLTDGYIQFCSLKINSALSGMQQFNIFAEAIRTQSWISVKRQQLLNIIAALSYFSNFSCCTTVLKLVPNVNPCCRRVWQSPEQRTNTQ